jgi:hypothetical protein
MIICDMITHPVYSQAKVIVEITWTLRCGNCGTLHRFDEKYTQLDPCCTKPIFKEAPHGKDDGYY